MSDVEAFGFVTGDRRWQARCGVVFTCIFALVLVVFGAARLTYDEPWYLESVALLHEHGMSTEFLRSLPGPAGPLYSVVHFAFEPLTRLAPPLVRWVNPLLLLGSILAISFAARAKTPGDVASVAATFFAIPMIWPCSGMALTDIPAVCAYSVHILALLQSLGGGRRHVAWAAVSGIALGAAVLGRQPLLLGVLPLAFLGIRLPARRPDLVLIVATAMLLVLPVFGAWQGVVPPKTAFVGGGLMVRHLLLAGGYAAVCTAVVCPDVLIWKPSVMVGCFLAGIALNMFGWVGWLPLNTVVERFISPEWFPLAITVTFGFVLAMAIWFFLSSAQALVTRRHDTVFVFLLGGILLQIATAMAVKHQFSSRYLLTAVPLLALLAAGSRQTQRFVPVRLGFGAALGCLSLINYLSMASGPGT